MENNNLLKYAMTYGLVVGMAVITYYVILYFAGINIYDTQAEVSYIGKIDYLIIAFGVFFSIKVYRDNILEGTISYKQSLLFGTATGFFASIVITFYIVIFFKFIDSETFRQMYIAAEEQMLQQQSFSDAEKDQLTSMAQRVIYPVIVVISILGNTFIAFLYSVFVSFFMRKKVD